MLEQEFILQRVIDYLVDLETSDLMRWYDEDKKQLRKCVNLLHNIKDYVKEQNNEQDI